MRRTFIPATALICVLILLWLWHQRHAQEVVGAAVQAERDRWQEVHRQALADAQAHKLKTETSAALAALEAQHELKQAQLALADARADLRVVRGELRDTITQFRDRASRAAQSSPAGSIAHGAVAAADALEECSSRYAAVAGVADALSVQVTGLQAYITRVVGPVCVAGLEGNIQVGQQGQLVGEQ
jgi:hypothetical protein